MRAHISHGREVAGITSSTSRRHWPPLLLLLLLKADTTLTD